MTADEWKNQIGAQMAMRPEPVRAVSYRNKQWPTASKPVVLGCLDGNDYVVKGGHAGRAIVNEQIVGTLGATIGAPVGEVKLIDVPTELVAMQAEISFLKPGLAHGSQLLSDCSEREWISNVDKPYNRERFARLAILYGLVRADDHQLIYRKTNPELVHSVDHGHFFPSGPNWTIATLGAEPAATPDPRLLAEASLLPEEISAVSDSLRLLDETAIARAVGAPPDEWGISIDERVAVAEYLLKRRDQLLATTS